MVVNQKESQEEFSLRRLDSFHLNQLTAKHFENSSPKKSRYAIDSSSSDGSCSPLKALGKLRLEAIDETDSFCTDSSYQSE